VSVLSYPEFFNDVFGPVMQPGSSSHTAAPCRLGYLARCLLGEPPAEIRVLLDEHGSFAGTFGLMHEDQGMLAGALGWLPDDPRIFDAAATARAAGIAFSFDFGVMQESPHINAMKFVLTGQSGKAATLVGDSTGGGMIRTRLVNGYPLSLTGDCFATLWYDPHDTLAAADVGAAAGRLAGYLDTETCPAPGAGRMYCVRTAEAPDAGLVRSWFPGYRVDLLRPVLPVLAWRDRRPQLFRTMTEWRQLAQERAMPLWEVAVQYEMDVSGWTRQRVIEYMLMIAGKMHRQTSAAYEMGQVVPESPFKPDLAALWQRRCADPGRLTDDLTANVVRLALGAGAGIPGVESVPGPMGSGGGYIYAALSAVKDAHRFGDDALLRGLFIAAGIGAIAYTRTEPTGEIIGCSGECGICGAMAAAAVAEMAGGTPAQVENAASLSLQAAMGWPCDPIPGGQSQPCRSRVLSATCMAPIFADLALAGRDAILPLHEVIDAVDAIGRRLPPELLCTSRGGCSTTPTALRQGAAYREWFRQARAQNLPPPPGNLI
jgi:L-serine dehydratase